MSNSHPLGDLGFVQRLPFLHDLGFRPDQPIGKTAIRAALADAKERTLQPDITNASNQPQIVGALDSASGRLITQPSDNPAVNQALATDAMQNYRTGLESAIGKIPGARLAASRTSKNPRRLAEKIALEGQPAETVSDYGAAQITVDSPQAKNRVIAEVQKRFPVLRERDNFAQGDPIYRYRRYAMQLQMPNGASQELQIIPREVFEANPVEHRDYTAARDAEITGKPAALARSAARAKNDAAMAKFNLRNRVKREEIRARNGARGIRKEPTAGILRKGEVVSLPDGSCGVISYLDPNMRIARIRTEGGKNMTLRQRDLTPLGRDNQAGAES